MLYLSLFLFSALSVYRDVTLWRSKIWRLFFFYTPRNFNHPRHPRPPDKLTHPLMGMTSGHYMESYMKYIQSKFAIIVLMPEIIFVSD